MLDTATRTPPTPDGDAASGAEAPLAADRAPLPQSRPGGAAPEDGKAADPGWLDAARREAEHIEREATVHAEAHFDSCARWSGWNTVLGFVSAVLGALTAGTIAAVLGEGSVAAGAQAAGGDVARVFDLQAHLKPLFATGALVAAVVAAAVRFLDPGTRSAQHGAAGKRYRALADEARQFGHLETTAGAARDGLFGRLRAMVGSRAKIHETAPVIPKRAYDRARKKVGEAVRPDAPAAGAGAPPG